MKYTINENNKITINENNKISNILFVANIE